ncbi:MAG: hypothetical protein U0802_15055, partial [Candidatus Binatia bacterium]
GWSLDVRPGNARPRLVAHDLEYFEAAQYGDVLDGAVWVPAVGDDGFETDCQLSIGGRRSLHARSRWRWSAGALPAPLATAVRSLAAPS